MFKQGRVAIAALAAGILGVAMAGSAVASTSSDANSSQTTGSLHCNSSVSGLPPGGKISARIMGSERRHEGDFFRTARVDTTYVVQKSINGNWYYYSQSPIFSAVLGAARPQGAWFVAPWVYGKAPSHDPRFGVTVATSGDYRLVIVSNLYNQDNIQFDQLVTSEGICRFQG